jgi:hypothetical protein
MSTHFTPQNYLHATLESDTFFQVIDTYPEIKWNDRSEIAWQMFNAFALQDIENSIAVQTWLNWNQLSPDFDNWSFDKRKRLLNDLTPVMLHYFALAQLNGMFSPIEGVMLYFLENMSEISFVFRHNDNV